MSRFILRFTGCGAPPDTDLERIRSATGVTVVDNASSRMLLVQGSTDVVNSLAKALPGWTSSPEQTIPLPDTRRKVRSPKGS